MSYNRRGTGPWAWVKTVGSADHTLTTNWLVDRSYLCEWVWFPKHPRSLRAGDLLAYYAAGKRVFPGIVEVMTDQVEDDATGHPVYAGRWRWKMAVKPHVVLTLDDAPTLGDVGLDPLRLRRQSHIRLDMPEFDAIRSAILHNIEENTAL